MVTPIVLEKVEILQDKSSAGRERPWKKKKVESLSVAGSYRRLKDNKCYRVHNCCDLLQFKECDQGHKSLQMAYNCRVRLCPMCSYRRSLVLFKQLNEILHVANEREKLRYVFLTLTAKTVPGYELAEELTRYFNSWKRFVSLTFFRKISVGWFRALEVTHDIKKGTYHPHFHVLLAVKSTYFSGPYYLSQKKWAAMWQRAMQLDYEPIVDVRAVKDDGILKEVSKYTTKPNDIISESEKHLMDLAVQTLDEALAYRRLVAFGGIFKEIRKELKHKEVDEADLIHIDEDEVGTGCTCKICESGMMNSIYRWQIGYKDYIKVPGLQKGIVDGKTGEVLF